MDTIFQISAIAVITAVCGCVVRQHAGSLSAVLSAAACIFILLLAFRFLRPILELIKRLEQLSGLSGTATAPMLKVAGIGILAQIAGGVCEDAGEASLNHAVQIGATVLSVYVSLPLMSAVLDLLEQILGG